MSANSQEQTFNVCLLTAVYMCPCVDDGRPMMLSRVASDAILDTAYAWLRKRRRDYPADADVWSFRRYWRQEKRRIRADLLAGRFYFSLLDRITLSDGSDIDLWSARDALVLKAMTIVLADILPLSPRCTHIKGNGGAKSAVRRVDAHLAANSISSLN